MRVLLVLLLLAVASGARAQTDCDAEAAVAERAPLLSQIAGDDADATAALADYVCAYSPEALTSTADLLRLLVLRDTVLARLDPRVEGWFFNPEGERYDDAEALYAETEALALQPVSAEGMIFGLAQAPLMDGVVTTLAPPDLTLYIDFEDARGASFGGEYPFMGLDPQIRMILAGEQLRSEYPSSPYVGATQEAFGEAILTLASLHPTHSEGIDGQWLVGVATTDFYPWASSSEALTEFARVAGTSRYAGPLAAILADPPIATMEGPMSVVVVSEGFASREDAAARSLAFLDQGTDVVGPLSIDGSWYVVYRYFPADERSADVAYDQASDKGLDPEVLTYTPEVY